MAAVLDWSVRPEFWNDQEFILVEYLPLKRMLLAAPVRERLETIAARDGDPGSRLGRPWSRWRSSTSTMRPTWPACLA